MPAELQQDKFFFLGKKSKFRGPLEYEDDKEELIPSEFHFPNAIHLFFKIFFCRYFLTLNVTYR